MGEVEIEIRPDGKVVVSTRGVKGTHCLKYTEAIAQIIGHEESRRLTDEYYEPDGTVRIHQHQRGNVDGRQR